MQGTDFTIEAIPQLELESDFLNEFKGNHYSSEKSVTKLMSNTATVELHSITFHRASFVSDTFQRSSNIIRRKT